MSTETRETLARIGSRASFLYSSGALRGSLSLVDHQCSEPMSRLCTQLTLWARCANRIADLRRHVLRPALQQPGRRYERFVRVHQGRPSGSVHWARTLMRQVGREGAQPEFVCRGGRRSLIAPENTLLVLWLDRLLAAERGLVRALSGSGFAGPDEKRWLVRFRREADHLLKQPAYQESRQEAARVAGAGGAALEELMREVRTRALGHPPAAPAWARRLLDVSTLSSWLPTQLARQELDPTTLWTLMAQLDALCVARRVWPLRQQQEAVNAPPADIRGMRFGHGDLALEPSAACKGWFLSQGGAPRAVIAVRSERSWNELRAAVLLADVDSELDARDVNNWLVFHRCQDAPEACSRIRHRGLEISFVRTHSRELPASQAAEVLSAFGVD